MKDHSKEPNNDELEFESKKTVSIKYDMVRVKKAIWDELERIDRQMRIKLGLKVK